MCRKSRKTYLDHSTAAVSAAWHVDMAILQLRRSGGDDTADIIALLLEAGELLPESPVKHAPGRKEQP